MELEELTAKKCQWLTCKSSNLNPAETISAVKAAGNKLLVNVMEWRQSDWNDDTIDLVTKTPADHQAHRSAYSKIATNEPTNYTKQMIKEQSNK